MRLLEALLISIKEKDVRGVIYKDNLYFWDPYDSELEGSAGRFTEFRSGIGTFGETLLFNHPDFAPKYNEYFDSDNEPLFQDAMEKYIEQKIRNMLTCEDYQPAN